MAMGSGATETKLYDIWAPILNFKKEITALNRPFEEFNWVPDEHIRRLKAYEILASFYMNYSRDYRMAPETGSTSQNDNLFEMGDPAWLCNRIKAKLLGDKLTIQVPGPKSLRQIKSLTMELKTTPDAQKQALLEELLAVKSKVLEREAWFQDWFDENDIMLAIDKAEQKCSYLGDCVYLPEWNEKEGIPDLKSYDPGFVFPYYELNEPSLETDTEDNPVEGTVKERWVIAWQEANGDSDDSYLLWRDIYELRKYPNGDLKCWRQYGYYQYSSASGGEKDVLSYGSSELVEGSGSNWTDLGLEFIPLEWIPNVEIEGEYYGLSNLHFLIDLFDAIINTYTDMKSNAELLGGASVFGSGKNLTLRKDSTTGEPVDIQIMPNTFYNLGEGGDAVILDTSKMQEALKQTGDVLEKKMLRNSNITEVGAGLTQEDEISGIALKILSQPLMDMILPMRRMRKRRYSKLFYKVQRLVQIYGIPEDKKLFGANPDDLYDAVPGFGNIIPTDNVAKLEEYRGLVELFGRETALEMIKEEGIYDFDIETVLVRVSEEQKAKTAAELDAFGIRTAAEQGQV